MSEIVDRLRSSASVSSDCHICEEAASHIEAIEVENATLSRFCKYLAEQRTEALDRIEALEKRVEEIEAGVSSVRAFLKEHETNRERFMTINEPLAVCVKAREMLSAILSQAKGEGE